MSPLPRSAGTCLLRFVPTPFTWTLGCQGSGRHVARHGEGDPLSFLSSQWQLQADGLARDIGVSNFGVAHLTTLLSSAVTPPAVNQVELSPFRNLFGLSSLLMVLTRRDHRALSQSWHCSGGILPTDQGSAPWGPAPRCDCKCARQKPGTSLDSLCDRRE